MLSILIVNWNTRDQLRACLQSIFKFPPIGTFETVVVDNDSSDGSAAMVESEFPDVRLLTPGENAGYARGNNLAFAAAKGEWLLTLNPDTEVLPGTLERAVEVLSAHPTYGALGAKLVGPDGFVQPSVRGFPSLLGIFGDFSGLGRLFPTSALGSYRLRRFDYTKECDAPQPMGTFLLFRREALEDVGEPSHPFDEQFPIFFNEVDLLFRLRKAGWPCLYSPQIEVLHHHGASTSQVRKPMIWESHRSLIRYLQKHSTGFRRAVLVPIASFFIISAAFIRARGFSAGFRA